MAEPRRRKSDPLAPPEGGWPSRPVGKRQERVEIAEWVWSLPELDPCRFRGDTAEYVERFLLGLAQDLLHDLNNRAMLPTRREHVERLMEIAKTSNKLLDQLDYFSGPTGILRIVALQSAFFRYQADSKIFGAPNLIDWDEVLAKPLSILSILALEEAEDIEKAAPGAGHQRLHDRLFGDPRHVFAMRSANTIAIFNGNSSVKSTEGGVVHTLMNRVWQHATGLDPEAYNLAAFLKKGVRDWRSGRPIDDGRLLTTVRNRAEKRRLRT